jgi:hypothetical protein
LWVSGIRLRGIRMTLEPNAGCIVIENGQRCGSTLLARGWCSKHYQRWRAHGDPLSHLRPDLKMTTSERFWGKVNRDGPISAYAPHLGSCWLWTNALNREGYGAFTISGKKVGAHIIAFEWLIGAVPEGLELDHLCRVRSCVNPAHLEAVTHKENTLRGQSLQAENARKTHCKRGHPFNETNTRVEPDGRRVCRTCRLVIEGRRQRSRTDKKDVGEER